MPLETKATYFSKEDSPERPRRNGDANTVQPTIDTLKKDETSEERPLANFELNDNGVHTSINPYRKWFKVSPFPAEKTEVVGGATNTNPGVDRRFLPFKMHETGRLEDLMEFISTARASVTEVLEEEDVSPYDETLLETIRAYASTDNTSETRRLLLNASVRNTGKERQDALVRNFSQYLETLITRHKDEILSGIPGKATFKAENENPDFRFGGEINDFSEWGELRTAWIHRVADRTIDALFNTREIQQKLEIGKDDGYLHIKYLFNQDGDLEFIIKFVPEKIS